MLYQRRYLGQSLQEYALIGSLVLLGCISILMVFGGNIKEVFQGLAPKPSQAQVTAIQNSSSLINRNAAAVGRPSLTADMKEVLTQPLATTVQTAGVNGVTRALTDTLLVIAGKAKETGKITEDQQVAFVRLSNQGHKLADIEAAFEKLAEAHEPGTDFFDIPLVYDGKKTTVFDLWQQIGFDVNNSYEHDLLHPKETPYSQADKFVELYHELKSTGALADPEMNALVTTISESILRLNYSLDLGLRRSYNTDPKDAAIIQERVISVLTHEGGAGICTAGKASDTGTFCSAATGGDTQ